MVSHNHGWRECHERGFHSCKATDINTRSISLLGCKTGQRFWNSTSFHNHFISSSVCKKSKSADIQIKNCHDLLKFHVYSWTAVPSHFQFWCAWEIVSTHVSVLCFTQSYIRLLQFLRCSERFKKAVQPCWVNDAFEFFQFLGCCIKHYLENCLTHLNPS